MKQETKVFRYDSKSAKQLADALTRNGYQFKELAYAKFQARGEGLVVSLYNSGKLVVQGKDIDSWAMRFLGEKEPIVSKPKDLPVARDQSSIGSDEAGKGDSFGGMTVCAVALQETDLLTISDAGVGDSKAMPDDRVRVLAPWIRSEFETAEINLSPEEYNQQHAECGSNVNKLLTKLHYEVQSKLHEKTGISVSIVDRFSASSPVSQLLLRKYSSIEVVEVPKAERFAAVGAASVLARDGFLTMMKNLSDEWALDIPLGSGTPVPGAMRRFLRLHGSSNIHRVAKAHFKNVQRILDEQRWN